MVSWSASADRPSNHEGGLTGAAFVDVDDSAESGRRFSTIRVDDFSKTAATFFLA
jgi:hypothetical protein